LTEVLAEKPSLLIDLIITDFVIITLDDDNGVVLQDCIDISHRSEFRQGEQDYSKVSLFQLKKIRQYTIKT
jgi:ribosome maturation factor RimP